MIAAHPGDQAIYLDCRADFMAPMATAIEHMPYARIRLYRPFIDWRKEEIVARGEELQVDFSQTWSCYQGGEIHCGRCGTCPERREAFLIAGIADPTEYEHIGPLPPKP